MAFTVKLRDLLAFLADGGWTYQNTEGDHHRYVHPAKPGKLTLVGDRGDDIAAGPLNSICNRRA
jgi:predicted RNA binding protein YcfA (HicA-like mRNA interferase family)